MKPQCSPEVRESLLPYLRRPLLFLPLHSRMQHMPYWTNCTPAGKLDRFGSLCPMTAMVCLRCFVCFNSQSLNMGCNFSFSQEHELKGRKNPFLSLSLTSLIQLLKKWLTCKSCLKENCSTRRFLVLETWEGKYLSFFLCLVL